MAVEEVTEMTRSGTRKAWVARVAVGTLLTLLSTVAAASPASAASNRLGNGKKLAAGKCIVDKAGTAKEAKFCVGKYYNINLYYKKKICWTWQAPGHISGPNAFVRVAANGDVGFYQYAGGRRLWHSGTTRYRGADLVVGSHGTQLQAILAVDTGSSFFTFKSCR